jgi:hypothetical protein
VQRAALSGRYPPNDNISFAVLFIIPKRPEYVNRKLRSGLACLKTLPFACHIRYDGAAVRHDVNILAGNIQLL